MNEATDATERIQSCVHASMRMEAWAGEVRVNLIRLAALAMFYGYHVLNAFVISDDPALLGRFHQAVSLVVMVTALLCVGENPRSMLVTAWFLIIASASLRFSLPPVYLSTVGSLLGYLVFLGHARYVLQVPDELLVPRTNQMIFAIAIAVAGLLAGQSIRQARRIAARASGPVQPANKVQQ